MLECLEKPFFGLLVPGQPAVALAQQVLQLRQLGGRGLALRIFGICRAGWSGGAGRRCSGSAPGRDRRTGARASSRRGYIGGLARGPGRPVRGVGGRSRADPRPRAYHFHDGSILAPEIEVLAQRLLGLFQVVAGLGAAARSSKADAFRRIWKPCTRCMPPPSRATPRAGSSGKPG